jgi:hypothetical protein
MLSIFFFLKTQLVSKLQYAYIENCSLFIDFFFLRSLFTRTWRKKKATEKFTSFVIENKSDFYSRARAFCAYANVRLREDNKNKKNKKNKEKMIYYVDRRETIDSHREGCLSLGCAGKFIAFIEILFYAFIFFTIKAFLNRK